MDFQRLRQATCAALLFFAAAFSAFAQTARFSGQITDQQNAAIPGAQIQVVNEDSLVQVQTKTDATGSYTIPYLPAGHYRIEVKAPGFNTAVHGGISLNVGQAFLFNVQLTVGQSQSTVTVNAGSEVTQVNTENAEVGGTITGKEVS
ncbi:carboxypeptidase-like regulatory domain-containing protein, partial [Paracidobacterium acidisoli]